MKLLPHVNRKQAEKMEKSDIKKNFFQPFFMSIFSLLYLERDFFRKYSSFSFQSEKNNNLFPMMSAKAKFIWYSNPQF